MSVYSAKPEIAGLYDITVTGTLQGDYPMSNSVSWKLVVIDPKYVPKVNTPPYFTKSIIEEMTIPCNSQ